MRQRTGNCPVQNRVATRHTPQGRNHLGVQMRRREQRIAGDKPIGHLDAARIIRGVEHGEHGRIDDRQAHGASRTSRTAATASSSVTPVPRGAEYSET